MVKWWNTELCNRVVDHCLQLHGGYGYMREFGVARAFADSRVQTIFGGTTEIMKEIIGRGLGCDQPGRGDHHQCAVRAGHDLDGGAEVRAEHLLAQHRAGGPGRRHPAAGQQDEAVGELARQREIVHGGHHGERALPPHVVDEFQRIHPAAEVQRARWLVEQQHRGLLRERAGQHRPLRLAAGQG